VIFHSPTAFISAAVKTSPTLKLGKLIFSP
jgi:hypothetical protein